MQTPSMVKNFLKNMVKDIKMLMFMLSDMILNFLNKRNFD